jgi:tetratricopeptide (TPR) repeat protein
MKYFATLGDRGTTKEMLSRAVALKQIGDVRFNQGELEPALKAFKQALAQAEALHKAEPLNNDYLFELGQAEFWVGYVAWQRGDLESAYSSMARYMTYSEKLAKRAPKNIDYQLELSYANSNLGAVAFAQLKPALALERFQKADVIAASLFKADSSTDLAMNLADTKSWIGSTFLELGKLQSARDEFKQAVEIMRPFHQNGEDKRASNYFARLLSLEADADISAGDMASARQKIEEAIQVHAKLLKNDSSNVKLRAEAQIAHIHKIGLKPISEWTENDLRILNQLSLEVAEMLAITPGDIDLLALQARLRSYFLNYSAYTSPTRELQSKAEGYLAEWHKAIAGKTKTPELWQIEALLEQSVGTVLYRTGNPDAAEALWRKSKAKLESYESRSLSLLAIRRLIALELDDTETATFLEKQLAQSGYKDPRTQPLPAQQ